MKRRGGAPTARAPRTKQTHAELNTVGMYIRACSVLRDLKGNMLQDACTTAVQRHASHSATTTNNTWVRGTNRSRSCKRRPQERQRQRHRTQPVAATAGIRKTGRVRPREAFPQCAARRDAGNMRRLVQSSFCERLSAARDRISETEGPIPPSFCRGFPCKNLKLFVLSYQTGHKIENLNSPSGWCT